MTSVWALAALWLGLALIASLLSIWFRVSTALSEIVVGTIAQLVIGAIIGQAVLGTDESWIKFLSGIGAIVLTFLAGAELDPAVFKLKWKEAAAVGLASFLFPFLGCAAAAYYVLGWEPMPSWLAGVAMSTTSVAVGSRPGTAGSSGTSGATARATDATALTMASSACRSRSRT